MTANDLIEKMRDEIGVTLGGGTDDPTLWEMHLAVCEQSAKAALRAIDEAGYAVVPKEPSEEMIIATVGYVLAPARDAGRHAYSAFLAAAPDVTGGVK